MKKYFFALITTCLGSYAFAQLAVRNEPRHHNVFENDYVRVLDVWIAPKDTTQFHLHATPSVFTTLTKTITSALSGQQAARSTSVAGSSWYDSLVTPRFHRVWNDDTTWFHVMDIELVAGKPHINEPVLQNAAMKSLFDEPLVRGYHIELAKSENFKLPSSKAGYLLVSLGEASVTIQSNGTNQHRLMKAGHYCWIDAGQVVSISSNNSALATFTLLQLK
ncbi:MAG: hypothetical protein ABI863_01565 [Ginsengibacter sp.]